MWAKALCSASDKDLETTVCFFLFQLTNEFPRKKHKPIVDLLESGQAPQSEYENPLRLQGELEL